MGRLKNPNQKVRFPGMTHKNGIPKFYIKYRRYKNHWWKLNEKNRAKRLQEKYDRGEVVNKLTEREKQALLAIRLFQLEEKFTPNIAYLSELFGYGPERARMIVNQLEKKGFIETIEWWVSANRMRRFILFPKGMTFPWDDWAQLPTDIFSPLPPAE